MRRPSAVSSLPRFVSTAIAVALTAFIALAADKIRLLRLQAFLHHGGMVAGTDAVRTESGRLHGARSRFRTGFRSIFLVMYR